MADVIAVKYDGLNLISGEFQTHSATVKDINQTLNDALLTLKNGGWLSPSATAFYKTLDEDVLVGMGNLIAALNQAGQTIASINATLQNGEQAAASSLPT